MKNLAGVPIEIANPEITAELEAAGLKVHELGFKRDHPEIHTSIVGGLENSGWIFERQWYYYAASGPGIPPLIAEEFHRQWGKVVRVEGHCGCPSPLEYLHGFAVGNYHIDSQDGLKAFADLLKKILEDAK